MCDGGGRDVIAVDDDEAHAMRVQALGGRRIEVRRRGTCELDAPEARGRGDVIDGG
jgi:hypothetical protein